MDVTKSIKDAGYIAVGAGVIGFQQAQVRRREIGSEVARRAQDARSCVAERGWTSIRSRSSTVRPREVRTNVEGTRQRALARPHGDGARRRRARARRAGGRRGAGPGRADRRAAPGRPRARRAGRRRRSDAGPRARRLRRRSAPLPPERNPPTSERPCTALPPPAAPADAGSVRARAEGAYAPPHVRRPGRWSGRRPLPARARARRSRGRGHRRREHRRRRRLPRPPRQPRPRHRHVHARGRRAPGAGMGPRRRDVRRRSTRSRATADRPGSASATATSRPTSTGPSGCAEGASLSTVTGEIAEAWGVVAPAAADERRPDRDAHHGRADPTAAAEELAMQEWFVRERAEPPVTRGPLRRRRRRAARARRARGARSGRHDPRLPVEPGDLDRTDPRRARCPRRARPAARPRRRREPDHRGPAGEGSGRSAHGRPRPRRLVRRRRARLRRVLQHARDRRRRRAPRAAEVEATACARSSPTR